ncbi:MULTISPECIES: EF-P beta-lysylation protein EpmB [Vibrio]|uniref:L-lysine 2,3-aminomutase n=1 Tax=Vibrio mediterranei TaxID=689 RepID=A0ABX5DBP4_9VIBR|nr:MULTISPECIES: EF-P beta-lysylation protein EpmB [Vibrio]MCF4176317.1 EF-P beta-lysylation protein EpmB [Vibrio sp. McD22-P3]MCG9656354.1 EF-P beta-lysylation protein EpmB [Vibrio mediterranei]MCG9665499.1 EF-P beta-lysylation protein EpmB [Vibrio mediterranei]MDA0110967.1 EF-P beta-lysylation protein EpmB [Vibrio sp. La 4.2.2]NOH29273.1 EF-P beta-lysylation protein EpmB [Vibrio mediterranei]
MSPIITRNLVSVEQNWLKQLSNAISDPYELLKQLEIDATPWENGLTARRLFPMRVPQSFVDRMEKGNPYDPLLRQVLPLSQEFEVHNGYSEDPLEEQDAAVPGLLHKYHNRALLIVKGGCAVNCRYCFRRHFPYEDNKGGKANWQVALDYIAAHPEIDEIILSGGDPLMAKDSELAWLVQKAESIHHLKTLRIHSRLPVVIPKRITEELCQLLKQTRLNTILVTHINHANEVNSEFSASMARIKDTGTTLLNQGVLLKGVNDSVDAQFELSHALFSVGILPYYLHVLDKVQGAAHFFISDDDAKAIIQGLIKRVSGYLVPKLTREEGGRASKTPLDLHLE